jgi:hypothetical protein
MADLEISVDINARGTKVGAAEAKREIKSIGDESEKTAKRVKTHSSAAAQDIKQIEDAAASTARASSIAGKVIGAVFAGIVIAAIAAAAAVFNVSKAFSDAGVDISKFQKQTGLSALTLSALESQFRRTGTSGEEFREGMKNLTKTITDAVNGTKEANAKMTRLGIDPQKALGDLDGTLRRVLNLIVAIPNPVEQAAAAMDAFGENGYKLLPFIKSFNGDIDGLIKKAKELGVAMSEDDVRAAVEFQKAYADVQEVVRGLIMTFAREYLPTVKDVLDRTGRWFLDNKATIQDWAVSSGNFVRGVISGFQDMIAWIEAHPVLARIILGVTTAGQSELLLQQYRTFEQLGAGQRPQNVLPNYDPNLNPSMPGFYNRSPVAGPGKAPKSPRAGRPEITEQQKQYQELQRLLTSLNAEIEFFGQETEEARVRQKYFGETILGTNNALFDQAIAAAQNIDALKAKKKAEEDVAKAAKDHADAIRQINDQIDQSTFNKQNDTVEQLYVLTKEIELHRELNPFELQQIANLREMVELEEQLRQANASPEEIAAAKERLQIGQQDLSVNKDKLATLIAQRELQKSVDSITGDLAGTLAELNEQYITGAEVTTVFRVSQELLKDTYKGLSEEQRQAILATAGQIDTMREAIKAQEEARRQYDDFRNTILDGLEAMEGGAGNFFQWMQDRFKRMLREMVADWLASKFFKLFYQGGNAQVQQQSGGGIFGGIFNGIFGGGRGGVGPGGTAPFNPAYFAGGATAGGGGTVGILSDLGASGNLPSFGKGGGKGYNAAGFGNIFSKGGIASMLPLLGLSLGPLLGQGSGAGSILGGVGGLLAGGIGAAFLSPGIFGAAGSFGATTLVPLLTNPFTAVAAGALIVGAILIGRNARRRKEEKIRAQGLSEALSALKEYDTIIADVRGLRLDPEAGIAQGTALGAQVTQNYMQMVGTLKDGKTRRIALKTLHDDIEVIIAQKMAELRGVADVARAAGDRDRRLIPEFAGGVYMSPAFQAFRRYNGMIAGPWTGRDTLPAMLGRGEMVLNPSQQASVIRGAGFDVFKGANIPGYANGGMAQSVPVSMEPVSVQVSIQQDASGMFTVSAKSDRGRKVILDVVGEGFANDEIKTQRRGG